MSVMSSPDAPLTSNTLHNLQRVRLMRSTRKLGELLGTTPQVLDLETFPLPLLPIGPRSMHKPRPSVSSDIKLQRRTARFYPSHSASSSFSSLESVESFNTTTTTTTTVSLSMNGSNPSLTSSDTKTKTTGSRKAIPRPLFLRLQSVPPPSTKSNDSSFTLSSPELPQTPTSPCMPSTPTPAEGANNRRRKMAKLIRTLGDNVPPELVFPDITKVEPLRFDDSDDTTDECDSDSSFDKDDDDDDNDVVEIGMPYMGYGWTREISPRSVSEEKIATTTPLAARQNSHARTQSHFTRQDTFVYANTTVNVAAHTGQIPTRRSGFEDFGWGAYNSSSAQSEDGHSAYQPSRWHGEWNRGDMKQVRRGLRALKAR